tara:strand:- start:295 stop:690 length:396 start_codon:yes stop_codon:yes gene_type:complete
MVKYLYGKGLHFSILWCDKQIISIHFGFSYLKWLFWYKPAYNKNFENYSPGKIHLLLLVKYGIENGFAGIDLLQGDEKYKFSWASNINKTETLIVNLGVTSLQFWWNTKLKKILVIHFGYYWRYIKSYIKK